MRIVIELEDWDPPRGTIALRAGVTEAAVLALPFGGWLSLVGRLYELIGRADEPLEALSRTD